MTDPSTYRGAGVDLAAADAAVRAITPHLERTRLPGVISGAGGFAGLFDLGRVRVKHPVLVTSTDGVGTKLELARQLDRHDTIGRDLVAMVVDDLVCSGARPLLFCDYLAVGKLEPAHVERIVAGIADGCVEAGCALVGGETAEHPGVMEPGRYDVAGFGVGIVSRDAILGPDRVNSGDAIVALASSGLHSNGYSLARRLVDGLDLADHHGLIVQTLGDALLRPTTIYAPACLALAVTGLVHAFCHVTGGGIPGNLIRVLPEGAGAVVDTRSFTVPDVFGVLQRLGDVRAAEMWRTFNMGAGMLAIVSDGRRAVDRLVATGIDAWECGVVTDRPGIALAGVS